MICSLHTFVYGYSGLAGTMVVGGLVVRSPMHAVCNCVGCTAIVLLCYIMFFFISKSRMAHLKGPSMSTFVTLLECVLRGRVAHHPTQWTVCACCQPVARRSNRSIMSSTTNLVDKVWRHSKTVGEVWSISKWSVSWWWNPSQLSSSQGGLTPVAPWSSCRRATWKETTRLFLHSQVPSLSRTHVLVLCHREIMQTPHGKKPQDKVTPHQQRNKTICSFCRKRVIFSCMKWFMPISYDSITWQQLSHAYVAKMAPPMFKQSIRKTNDRTVDEVRMWPGLLGHFGWKGKRFWAAVLLIFFFPPIKLSVFRYFLLIKGVVLIHLLIL